MTPKPDTWTVPQKFAGVSLQEYLAETLGISKRAAKQQIDARAVWVNDRCVWMAHHALKRGDVVRLPRRAPSPTALSARPKKLPVLFEDDDFLVVDKPAGLVSEGSDASVEALLRLQLADPRVQAVHRLDRDTTGCLLFAKSPEAMEAAVRVFREHHIRKTYRAIVHERWDASASTLDLAIEGERALTQVTCVRANARASYLVVRIETGRTHQIRRHLAMARHPVLGDRQYGPKEITDPAFQAVRRPMLHAAELLMEHPTHPDRDLRVFSPIPQDFHTWLNRLKLQ